MDHPRSRGVYVPPMRRAWAGKGSSPLARGLPEEPGILPETSEDHPRSRGVYTMNSFDSRSAAGSSPLARGLPINEIPHPTDAVDHPRSRGVYTRKEKPGAALIGSSPLARGLRRRGRRLGGGRRIIPARAGFTRWSAPRRGAWWDHPRSRGVYEKGITPSSRGMGSSPLARGLQGGVLGELGDDGIIPARAGFTSSSRPRRSRRSDHPRSRGVYTTMGAVRARAAGSSPLARGLLDGARGQERGVRIIPARAGFTRHGGRQARCGWDHPRSRGVYLPLSYNDWLRAGSSPLARGLLPAAIKEAAAMRIIPARAGFTTGGRSTGLRLRDHPRSRGVYTSKNTLVLLPEGSSPLARGLHDGTPDDDRSRRIIPARAGFTSSTGRSAPPTWDHPRSRGVYR